MKEKYDLCIIGGGPGGYVAAIRASQLGLQTIVIEKDALGGVCLNWGCIPTKALLRSAEILDYSKNLEKYGLNSNASKQKGDDFDIKNIIDRSRAVAKQLNAGVTSLLKKNKVDVVMAEAKIVKADKDKVTVEANGKKITATNLIIATGARARSLPFLKADQKLVWTAKEAMTPKFLPKKLGIIGSGAIGIEFASFYRSLGVEVTIFEMLDNILAQEDFEISKLARQVLEKRGISILTSCNLTGAKVAAKSVSLSYSASKDSKKVDSQSFDAVILAVGVQGNIEDIGLDKVKVKTEASIIKVDPFLATSHKNIFAIGDVAGPPMLAHKAEHEGVICVEKIAGLDVKPMNKAHIPGCTYSNPQIASIGITEQKAKEQNLKVKIGKFPYIANGKAIALGESQGMIKTIFDAKTGELLGAHMIGSEVTELIQGYAVAMACEATEAELMHTIFPHPTLSEAMHESVLAAYGRAIHI